MKEKLFTMMKDARDENWSDNRVELEAYRFIDKYEPKEKPKDVY